MPNLPASGTYDEDILDSVERKIGKLIAAFDAADVRLMLTKEIVAAYSKALGRATALNAPNREEIEEGLERALKELDEACEAYRETREKALAALDQSEERNERV